ncbi:MAG: tRNA lysidine(34) synthetase TilS [Desulfovibrio sp.]|nr:tRNA lysidine(34) synthetase TilS [Desulfovibrio sp.]
MQLSLPGRYSPAAFRLLRLVEHFCLEQLSLPHGSHLLLGVSGGADSTALALIMRLLSPRLGLTLHALSINHGLRPEAGKDASIAQEICNGLDIPCLIRRVDVRRFADEHRMGLEDAGRRLRYALLEQERLACGAEFIALGHHAGDVSEDVLLRLVRGTGWPALGGMSAHDSRRHLIRPLLITCPADLRALLRECGLIWREDSSNADPHFTRNRLRNTVLPLLKRENPQLERSLTHLWQLARLDEEFWNAQLDMALATCPWQKDASGILLPAALLNTLPPAARLRLYMRAIHDLLQQNPAITPHTGQARASTLLNLDTALQQKRGNTHFQLPGFLEAHLTQGAIHFRLLHKNT